MKKFDLNFFVLFRALLFLFLGWPFINGHTDNSSHDDTLQIVKSSCCDQKCNPPKPPQSGPPGPPGPQGAQGAAGTFAPDFAFIFLNGSAEGTAVDADTSIPFATIANTPVGTNITYASPLVTISDTGFYLVTFGVSTRQSNEAFQLLVNGMGATENTLELSASNTILTMTTIINITMNPSTLEIRNVSSNATVNDRNDGGGPAAYITIVKLQ